MLIDETGEILYLNHQAKEIIGFDENIKYFQDYLIPDCWQELNKLLKSITEASSEKKVDAFNLQFDAGINSAVNLSIKEFFVGDKKNYLVKILPFQVTIASDSYFDTPANFEIIYLKVTL
jgi:hypothetical protein